MKSKTSELSGPSLDWAVAEAEGEACNVYVDNGEVLFKNRHRVEDGLEYPEPCAYSTNWPQGGPIIERERIAAYSPVDENIWYSYPQMHREGTKLSVGSTYLIAAMRCYVASRLGNTVEVPDELCKESL